LTSNSWVRFFSYIKKSRGLPMRGEGEEKNRGERDRVIDVSIYISNIYCNSSIPPLPIVLTHQRYIKSDLDVSDSLFQGVA
jgi:hypothetical protein